MREESSINLMARFLNCFQGSKRIFRGSFPQMRAVFETGVDLGLVEGEKVQGREKSLGPE